ncbi:hypothetical protein CAXC1_70002 [Candidatus Xenohaliotis californiensis]|uniref:Uncharacterized protein n=1 Tax=Candidatus Xenohaliotis californiensis TaxID=84677 RepID=A0ABM9N992_9RICK|nr:hypothetical protein CAXC1_70002 [Candidatus Xenohaliotis californiensis]
MRSLWQIALEVRVFSTAPYNELFGIYVKINTHIINKFINNFLVHIILLTLLQ